ncbi:hypothetical protein CSUI_006625, partial [Cystoisospora suis]
MLTTSGEGNKGEEKKRTERRVESLAGELPRGRSLHSHEGFRQLPWRAKKCFFLVLVCMLMSKAFFYFSR